MKEGIDYAKEVFTHGPLHVLECASGLDFGIDFSAQTHLGYAQLRALNKAIRQKQLKLIANGDPDVGIYDQAAEIKDLKEELNGGVKVVEVEINNEDGTLFGAMRATAKELQDGKTGLPQSFANEIARNILSKIEETKSGRELKKPVTFPYIRNAGGDIIDNPSLKKSTEAEALKSRTYGGTATKPEYYKPVLGDICFGEYWFHPLKDGGFELIANGPCTPVFKVDKDAMGAFYKILNTFA
jgi:hypothetical protein